MRHLVPAAVLLLTVSAVAAALRPPSPQAAELEAVATAASARAMWIDARGHTRVLVERGAVGEERIELESIDAAGALAWRRVLAGGWLSALAEAHGQLYIAAVDTSDGSVVSRVLGVDAEQGQLLWSVRVEGEVTDLLVDPQGGLRARSVVDGAGGPRESLLGIHAGVVRWRHALTP